MTLPTFPIQFPILERMFVEADLRPNRRQAAGVIASGNDFVVDRGAPQWTGSWKTRTLTDLEMGQWEAWAYSLRGAQRFFLGFDPRREYPMAYMPQGWPPVMTQAGGAAWKGVCNLASIGVAVSGNDLAELNQLPAGFQLGVGDYLSVAYGAGLVSLHKVLAGGKSDGTGALAGVWIEPEFPASVAAPVTVTLQRACAKLRLTKFDAPKSAEGGLRVGSVSFSGISVAI